MFKAVVDNDKGREARGRSDHELAQQFLFCVFVNICGRFSCRPDYWQAANHCHWSDLSVSNVCMSDDSSYCGLSTRYLIRGIGQHRDNQQHTQPGWRTIIFRFGTFSYYGKLNVVMYWGESCQLQLELEPSGGEICAQTEGGSLLVAYKATQELAVYIIPSLIKSIIITESHSVSHPNCNLKLPPNCKPWKTFSLYIWIIRCYIFVSCIIHNCMESIIYTYKTSFDNLVEQQIKQ